MFQKIGHAFQSLFYYVVKHFWSSIIMIVVAVLWIQLIIGFIYSLVDTPMIWVNLIGFIAMCILVVAGLVYFREFMEFLAKFFKPNKS